MRQVLVRGLKRKRGYKNNLYLKNQEGQTIMISWNENEKDFIDVRRFIDRDDSNGTREN